MENDRKCEKKRREIVNRRQNFNIANIILRTNIRHLKIIFLSGTKPWKPQGMRTPWHRLRERRIFTANPVETRICTYSTISRSSATILRYVHVHSQVSHPRMTMERTRMRLREGREKKKKNWRVNDEQDIGQQNGSVMQSGRRSLTQISHILLLTMIHRAISSHVPSSFIQI